MKTECIICSGCKGTGVARKKTCVMCEGLGFWEQLAYDRELDRFWKNLEPVEQPNW
ncbi:hypothetical protein [Aneurinibacillus migulanus]|uniref:Uncharacterized protein n=1 Tax=Aneurinibacillus migulanus TaxID=47500 RepID=A0A1G8PI77_ANEMI|nr:hypothetical protein [Aneurinibacillus migulanus]MED0892886.1 hypothetical protein [Aneurinibacillus migulanus]MED1619132.1 hypothetical protein [Aneurinibacillus migulanus]GED14024.1 hypothetical protein AMI01nite_20150 [Aneurinibacillus migulanus]SDI91530.1 hypothetical protein SAMN04487909_10976 [Aneurinibacillus migulanus]